MDPLKQHNRVGCAPRKCREGILQSKRYLGTGGIMFELISLTIALGIGFACGYSVRELKSQRRRAAAREEHFRRQEQRRYDHPNVHWISPVSGLSDTDGPPVLPEMRTRWPISMER